VIGVRGKRPPAAALAVVGIVLAQLVGCASCVKDEDVQQGPGSGRAPIDLRAADQRFSQVSTPDARGADAASD
jgi:hypothetical protein